MYSGVRLAQGGVSSLSWLRSASDKLSGPSPASSCRYKMLLRYDTGSLNYSERASRPVVAASTQQIARHQLLPGQISTLPLQGPGLHKCVDVSSDECAVSALGRRAMPILGI
jgi:hypothetical protein